MAAGQVKGEGFAVDACVMEANAKRQHGKAPDEIEWVRARTPDACNQGISRCTRCPKLNPIPTASRTPSTDSRCLQLIVLYCAYGGCVCKITRAMQVSDPYVVLCSLLTQENENGDPWSFCIPIDRTMGI
jgi:hypothetical protein